MFLKADFVKYIYTCLSLLTGSIAFTQSYLEREDVWVKSKMAEMSIDQKIGQIFIVRAYSKGDINEEKLISEYIKKYQIGGVCFFQGSPSEQVSLINKYQSMATIPMFMAIDGEWGLAMRFPKETISFPKQMMLGAIQDNKLIYEMGKEIARQCKRAGINMNFAPSVDINNNPSNPVIFDRSFGEIPQNVTAKGYMYMKAMEDEGIMSCIKHFPGHGDTNIDSHHDLPVLNYDRNRLDQLELFPFRRLSSQGVSAIMIGHLHLPALDNRPNRPASLSEKIVKNVIRSDMGFNGLLITDAMDMKGVTTHFPNGLAEAEAFAAGNDIILLPENLPKAFQKIKEYLKSGKITEERVDESVERILRSKYKLGLNNVPTHFEYGVNNYLSRNYANGIKQKLTEAALTLVSDKDGIIPIKDITDVNIGSLSINNLAKSKFQDRIDQFAHVHHYQLMPYELSAKQNQMIQTLSQFKQVIIGIHTSGRLRDFSNDISPEMIRFLKEINNKTQLIIVLFGSPYLLKKLDFASNILLAYDNDPLTQDVAAQSLFGVNQINGKLSVSANEKWPAGFGLERKSLQRLGYALPEMVNLSSDTLKKIDAIMEEIIRLQASPGGQVLVAKDGKIVFQKAYGRQSFDGYYVNNNTVYDIASITKILSTTISAMKLVDDHKLMVNNPLRYYIAGIDTTNKANLSIKDIMAHHAGLLPWIGFYESTLLPQKSYGYNPKYYSGILQESYRIPVAKGMFMRTDYKDSIFQQILSSNLRTTNNYKYSDLGFYLMQKVIENESGLSLDVFTSKHFYKPLGLKYTGYLPLLRLPEGDIAPTEIDNYFRMQLLKGYVHDMGAAMLGGVAGHAGVFSNAKEMAILMQMLLNKGSYGGQQFIKPETIKLFTTRHERSTRRGLGFDMKELDPTKMKSTSSLAPPSVFGHTGFTGTAAWADPENNIVYIFCANRTYPSGNKQTLNNNEYRIKIQTLIYKAMVGHSDHNFLTNDRRKDSSQDVTGMRFNGTE
jgi:beta-glucosidase-like glycosyl hydrolase/CubicO group peptidase (beta-lactamase class C family)